MDHHDEDDLGDDGDEQYLGTATKGERDLPLSFQWLPVADNAFAALGLPAPRSWAVGRVRTHILAQAVLVGRDDPGRWISYSRRRAFYAARRKTRYWPRFCTYKRVVAVVDQLAELGLLDHVKVPPGNLGVQSRFKASHALMQLLTPLPLSVVQKPVETIILRDEQRKQVDYKDTEQTHRWRRNVEKINAMIRSAEIGLGDRVIRQGISLRVADANGPASNQLRRVFNRSSLELGGRFYGAWWQNIPKEIRAHIAINGAATEEMDYPRLHPTLVYAQLNLPLCGDPYDLPGTPRPLVKSAFNTLLNADSRQAAVRAIANEIGGKRAFAKANALVREIEAKHAPIAHMFGSGAGLRLMRWDSNMTERLLLRLAKRGVVALPIHDSFIVRLADKPALVEGMAEALRKFAGNSNDRSISYGISIPQNGAPLAPSPASAMPPGVEGGPPVGSIVVFLLERPQLNFFGPDTFPIQDRDIFDWNSGIAPKRVRQALRREMNRRGLTHAAVAHRVGVGRPHFENILQGRDGTSSTVATRIREFLIEGAKTVGTSV